MSSNNLNYSMSNGSETESGSSTPVLNSGTSALADDGYEGYVEPTAMSADHSGLGLPNFADMAGDAANDEDCNILSVEMASICKELIYTSVACLAKHKTQLHAERVKQVAELETRYCIDMQLQEEIVAKERADMVAVKEAHALDVQRLESTADKVTALLTRKLQRATDTISKQALFHSWAASTAEAGRMAGLRHTAEKFHRRSLLWRAFSGFQRDVRRRLKKRLTAESQVRMDDATKEVIVQYELKYKRLSAELEEAHRLLQAETENRKAFEGQLKRVFLKNLTHMNMEANALFNANQAVTAGMEAKAGEQHEVAVAMAAVDPQSQTGRSVPVFLSADVFGTNGGPAPRTGGSDGGGLAGSIMQQHKQKARVVFASNVASSSSSAATTSRPSTAPAGRDTAARSSPPGAATSATAARKAKAVPEGVPRIRAGVGVGGGAIPLRGSMENAVPRNTGPPQPVLYSAHH